MQHQQIPADERKNGVFLKKLKAGDKLSLREFVTRFQSPVYNLAYKILWNKEDAEDVLQEAFIKIIKNLADFRGESNLATWIYKIATNTALMKLRERRKKQGRLAELDEIDVQDIMPSQVSPVVQDPFDDLLQNESIEILEKAIDQLPEIYRGAFVLKDVEQLPTEDITYILGISADAFYSRLKRARMLLREAVLAVYQEERN